MWSYVIINVIKYAVICFSEHIVVIRSTFRKASYIFELGNKTAYRRFPSRGFCMKACLDLVCKWVCDCVLWLIGTWSRLCSLRFFIGKTVQEIDRWTFQIYFMWNGGWLMVGKKKKKNFLSHIKTFRNLKVSPNKSYNFLIICLSLIVSLSFFYSVYYSSTVLSLCLLSVFLSTYIL